MIYKNDAGQNIIQFGTGDIEVGNGRVLSDDGTEMMPACMFAQLKNPQKIGSLITPEKINDPAINRDDANTFLVFTDIRSFDVVISHLKEAKERFKRNGLKVMSMQEITDEVADMIDIRSNLSK